MRSNSGKALYLLVASILGVLLFSLLQSSIFTVYNVLLGYSQMGKAGISDASLQTIDAVTTIVALFFGAWYGIWLGLNWHSELYGQGQTPGMFHGFLPHSLRKAQREARKAAKSAYAMPSAVKTAVSKSMPKKSVAKSLGAWTFDDLQSEVAEKKTVRKPRLIKARKPAAKKKTVLEKVA